MRTQIRSALVAGVSAVLLATGSGAASAQGSLDVVLPFPLDIPGIASLFGGSSLSAAPPPPADSGQSHLGPPETAALTTADVEPALALPLPPEVTQRAFEGTVIAGLNEARTAMGLERLVTDPRLTDDSRAAAERAATDPDADPVAETLGAETMTRVVLDLDPGTSPQTAIATLLADPWSRDQVFDHEVIRIGVGAAASEDGREHVVLDFDRA